MIRELLIEEEGPLRLYRCPYRRGRLEHDEGGVLLEFELREGFHNTAPVGAVISILESFQPTPPQLVNGPRHPELRGWYDITKNEITICGLNPKKDADAYAEVLLHELAHGTGHSAALARPDFAPKDYEPLIIKEWLDYINRGPGQGHFAYMEEIIPGRLEEEVVAYLTGSLAAVRLGIQPPEPRWKWFNRASKLPLAELRRAIAGAKAACAFLFHDEPPPA